MNPDDCLYLVTILLYLADKARHAYLKANPDADRQAILVVRNGEKIKYGAGINIEQAINDDLGFFLRAMKADGRTETYAFAETDGSIAVGFALKGAE